MTICLFDILEQTSKKIESKYNKFHSRKFENAICKIVPFGICLSVLTHCELMTPYGNIDLCQHWLRR